MLDLLGLGSVPSTDTDILFFFLHVRMIFFFPLSPPFCDPAELLALFRVAGVATGALEPVQISGLLFPF